MDNIVFSIITVCRNAEKDISQTMDSVQRQTYPLVDYVIEDGGSTDNTLDIVRQKEGDFPFRWYSQKDLGIYDGMNIAAGRVKGDFILFLNAGDILADEYVLENMAVEIKKSGEKDIFFGNVILKDEQGKRIFRKYAPVCGTAFYYLSGDSICHQAIIAGKGCVQRLPFLTDYRICADREWILRLIREKCSFQYVDLYVSECEMEGFSTQHQILYEEEVKRCIRKHVKTGYPLYLLLYFMKQNKVLRTLLRKIGRKKFCE